MAFSQKDKAKPFPSAQQLAGKPASFLARFVVKKCRQFYYRTRESFGQHKRDIVVLRVEEACESLQDTREHFEQALERFKGMVQFDAGSLESRYMLLKRQFEISQNKAQQVSDRITAIEEVSEALFLEWEAELAHYTNRSLRSRSRQQLKVSRQNYGRLIKAMHRAEAKIKPVLAAFRDQVLFLKHNLNAQAIAALQNELLEIGVDIMQLIQAMEKSINEANAFVSTLVPERALPAPDE
ncbi:DUF2959 domain-containing protein [Thiolapillus sp.]|uniref:DUF2959 domain-containing protein n=1 Tax=Thiolapillus sp. TaxID=2017437 RepID=UPI003AF80511